MTPAGAALSICIACFPLYQAGGGAGRIISTVFVRTVNKIITIVVYSVTARSNFVAWRRFTVIRTIALIFFRIASSIATNRRQTAVYRAISAVFLSIADSVTAAV
jgi:hypothetical protein